MTYKDFFLYTTDYWDFSQGFKFVAGIVDLVRNLVKEFNFNRYSAFGEGSPNADPDAHITIRLDLENFKSIPQIEAKLEEMKNRGEIDDWCREEDNIWDIKPLREYLPVYHTAHENSTKCAFRFYEELKNTSELENFLDKKSQYLLMFFPLWLKYSGFTLLNSISVDTYAFIDSLSRACSESFRETVDRDRIGNRTSLFTARLVHLFFNCICVHNQEPQIVHSVMRDLGFTKEVPLPLDEKNPFYIALGESLIDT